MGQAFYDATKRTKLDDFEIMYNGIVPKNASSYLDFRAISWRRINGYMYEFTAAATYYIPDGDEIKLGALGGYRNGIGVLIRRDIKVHFADSAERAFCDALKNLWKNCPRQSTAIDRNSRKTAEAPSSNSGHFITNINQGGSSRSSISYCPRPDNTLLY